MKRTFLILYELSSPVDSSQERIRQVLDKLEAREICGGAWAVYAATDAKQVRQTVKKRLGPDDAVSVFEVVDGKWSPKRALTFV